MRELEKRYRLLDVTLVDTDKETQEKRQYIQIEDGVITGRGDVDKRHRDSSIQEIDLEGMYVMPGLIDAHVHLSGGRGGIVYGDTEVLAEPKMVRAMRSVCESQKMLKRGITSLRDISWNGLYLKRIYGEGIAPGPRVIACGPGLTRTGGHADIFQFTEEYVKEQHYWGVLADGNDEVRKWVRRILREGADQIKIWASGGGNWEHDKCEDVHYSFEEIKTCVDEAHRAKGTFVCAHAENAESIWMCLKAGVDTIEHGEELDEEACAFMRDNERILVPTLALGVNWYEDFIPDPERDIVLRPDVFLHRTGREEDTPETRKAESRQIEENFKMAMEYGVTIAMGSDTIYEPLTEYGEYSLKEYKTMVECGMTVPQAVRAATVNSAAALNMLHKLGTLEPGKEADMLVVRKDPYESADVLYDASNIRSVISAGRLAVNEGLLAY